MPPGLFRVLLPLCDRKVSRNPHRGRSLKRRREARVCRRPKLEWARWFRAREIDGGCRWGLRVGARYGFHRSGPPQGSGPRGRRLLVPAGGSAYFVQAWAMLTTPGVKCKATRSRHSDIPSPRPPCQRAFTNHSSRGSGSGVFDHSKDGFGVALDVAPKHRFDVLPAASVGHVLRRQRLPRAGPQPPIGGESTALEFGQCVLLLSL